MKSATYALFAVNNMHACRVIYASAIPSGEGLPHPSLDRPVLPHLSIPMIRCVALFQPQITDIPLCWAVLAVLISAAKVHNKQEPSSTPFPMASPTTRIQLMRAPPIRPTQMRWRGQTSGPQQQNLQMQTVSQRPADLLNLAPDQPSRDFSRGLVNSNHMRRHLSSRGGLTAPSAMGILLQLLGAGASRCTSVLRRGREGVIPPQPQTACPFMAESGGAMWAAPRTTPSKFTRMHFQFLEVGKGSHGTFNQLPEHPTHAG